METIGPLFNPRSVVVVGASRDQKKWGYQMARSLVESTYEGTVHLVNRSGEPVLGRPTYRSVADIPDEIDLAVIGIPAAHVPESVDACLRRGVRSVIVISAGFAETGAEGGTRQEALVRQVRSGGARLVGPNCLGIYNGRIGLNTTLLPMSPGDLAFVTQSGNLGLELAVAAGRQGLGFSLFASCGNQADIKLHEYVEAAADDEATKAIMVYVEGVDDGPAFLEAASRAVRKKPVVAMKIGRFEAGIRSATSHTGSLAGRAEVFAGAMSQAGVVQVRHSTDLLDVAAAFRALPLPAGPRIAVLADGGGHATIAADLLEEAGLTVPVLSAETQSRLREWLPPQASVRNPVDFAGGAENDLTSFVRCSETLLADPGIDGLVIVGQFGGYGDIFPDEFAALECEVAADLADLARQTGKPLMVQTMYAVQRPECLALLVERGIPVYERVETAATTMAALWTRSRFLGTGEGIAETNGGSAASRPSRPDVRARDDDPPAVGEIVGSCRRAGRVLLLEPEARSVLEAVGIDAGPWTVARSEQEAAEAVERWGDVAMKVVSGGIAHKSDVGGVELNVGTPEAARKAFCRIVDAAAAASPEAHVEGILVSPMLRERGVELIVGTSRDEVFGPVVMVGVGGIMVEAMGDVTFRVAPVSPAEALTMLRELRGAALLNGFRGAPPADLATLAETVAAVSELAARHADIAEIDINPLVALADGVALLDARIILTSAPSGPPAQAGTPTPTGLEAPGGTE